MAKVWTDIDYAQAAIDMLPGSVKEIEAFLRAQGIKNPKLGSGIRSQTCPIAQWVRRWTDVDDIGAGFERVRVDDEGYVEYPLVVGEYVVYADREGNRS